MNSDFIRFFPIFKLFPTFRLLDSTTLVQISRESVEFIMESVNVGRESVERVELWQLFINFENSW